MGVERNKDFIQGSWKGMPLIVAFCDWCLQILQVQFDVVVCYYFMDRSYFLFRHTCPFVWGAEMCVSIFLVLSVKLQKSAFGFIDQGAVEEQNPLAIAEKWASSKFVVLAAA